jgi:hypothetical protein
MMLDIATIADYAAVFSLFIAIISIIVSARTKRQVDKFIMIHGSIKINRVDGDVNITGNSST